VILLAGIAAGAAAWLATPNPSDVQARVNALARARNTPVLGPDDVPNLLALAVVATEDERFYVHHGIDGLGLARAALNDIRMRCLCEGGSTVTEQLVKMVYLNGSDLGADKFVDMSVAFKVELVLDKPHIMADWLTLAPTGPTVYGVYAAACKYFGSPLARLDLAQYALLAGLPQSPVADDPRTHPEAASQRREQVLDAMLAHHYIDAIDAAAAGAEPLLPATGKGC
jgi:membrane peptidoglycan carboxypeptidase